MATGCDHDHGRAAPSAAALDRALAGAEARAARAGERLTPPRRRVLELLLGSGGPVKAYDLIARYGRAGEAAKPPTVYRALAFLEAQGLAHRIASISAYVACTAQTGGDGDEAHAAAFLICDCCGATREVSIGERGLLAQAAGAAGYVLERTTVEGHGRCAPCAAAA